MYLFLVAIQLDRKTWTIPPATLCLGVCEDMAAGWWSINVFPLSANMRCVEDTPMVPLRRYAALSFICLFISFMSDKLGKFGHFFGRH